MTNHSSARRLANLTIPGKCVRFGIKEVGVKGVGVGGSHDPSGVRNLVIVGEGCKVKD